MRRIAILVLALALIVPMTAGAATADQDPNGVGSAGQGATADQDPDGLQVTAVRPWVDSLFRVLFTHLGI